MPPSATPDPPVLIGVPVRDERDRLPELLRALDDQERVGGRRIELFLYFDGCADGGDRLAAAWQPVGYRLNWRVGPRRAVPNAGLARRRAMAMCVDAAEADRAPDAALLTTDADSRPAADWCARNVAALSCCDIALGAIRLSQGERDGAHAARARIERCLARIHALRRLVDPLPWEDATTHAGLGGASMATTLNVYRAIGGFAPLANGEDLDFVARARAAGYRVRQDDRIRVVTSARRHGRATAGLAAEMERLHHVDRPRFANPHAALALYRQHGAARAYFDAGFDAGGSGDDALKLAAELDVPVERLRRVRAEAPNAEAFVNRLLPPHADAPTVPLKDAERALDELEASLQKRHVA